MVWSRSCRVSLNIFIRTIGKLGTFLISDRKITFPIIKILNKGTHLPFRIDSNLLLYVLEVPKTSYQVKGHKIEYIRNPGLKF